MTSSNEAFGEEERKSTVTVGVKRLLNTAQYENIEINVSATEEVFWSSQKERARKIDNITAILTDKYKQVQTYVLNELGVTEKVAWRKPPASKAISTAGDELLR